MSLSAAVARLRADRQAMLRHAATALLVLAVVAGAANVRTQADALGAVEAENAGAERIGGYRVKRFLGPDGTRFLAYVRATLPPDARVNVVLPVIGPVSDICGTEYYRPFQWWVAYVLLPRPVACDGTEDYWVYVGVNPADRPPPAGSLLDPYGETFGPGYAVAELP